MVKYHEQSDIEFSMSKLKIMKVFRLLNESDSDLPIVINDCIFKQDDLKSLHYEGLTDAFYSQ